VADTFGKIRYVTAVRQPTGVVERTASQGKLTCGVAVRTAAKQQFAWPAVSVKPALFVRGPFSPPNSSLLFRKHRLDCFRCPSLLHPRKTSGLEKVAFVDSMASTYEKSVKGIITPRISPVTCDEDDDGGILFELC
jgi:hypothetical protein